jgi:Ca2+-binding RTX toxin-like protein
VPTPIAWSPLLTLTQRIAPLANVRIVQQRNGDFWVLWTDSDQTGVGEAPGTDIIGQRYNAFGEPQGGEVLLSRFVVDINTGASGDDERNPDVAPLVDRDGFALVYEDVNAQGGAHIVLEIKTPTTTTARLIRDDQDGGIGGSNYRNPTVAIASATSGLVVYESINAATGQTALSAQMFDPTTGALTSFRAVVQQLSEVHRNASVAVLPDGRYAVVWEFADNIRLRILNLDGTAENIVNVTTGASIETDPSIAALADGRVIITYTRDGDIFAALATSVGNSGFSTIPISLTAGQAEGDSHIVALSNNSFAVAWENTTNDGVRLKVIDVSGNTVTVPTESAGIAGVESVSDIPLAAMADGRILVGFNSPLGGVRIMDPRAAPNAAPVYTPNSHQVGTPAADTFTAADNAAIVHGGAGNDVISDGVGTTSWFFGGEGDDTIRLSLIDAENADGGPGTDTVVFTALAGAATIDLAAGTATDGVATQSLLNFENFTADLSVNIVVTGAAGVSDLRTGSGDDLLDLGPGGGFMRGGSGSDTYIVNDSGLDQVIEVFGPGVDTIRTTVAFYQLPNNVENLAYIGAGAATLRGNSANNVVTGGPLGDVLLLQDGGSDVAQGGEGSDGLYFGDALSALDTADGGAGDDQLAIRGNYDLTLGAATIANVETLALLSGSDTRFGGNAADRFDYVLRLAEGNIAAGQSLIINANGLLAGEDTTIDASREGDGSVRIFSGAGAENLIGGLQSDGFFFGDARFSVATDKVNGTAGADDQLGLRGDYSALQTFAADTIVNIDTIAVISATDTRFGAPGQAFSYNLKTHDGNLAAGAQLIVSGGGLAASETLTFDGRSETDGFFRLIGGAGNDLLRGGGGNDAFFGGLGADQLQGNGGADTFFYTQVNQSAAAARDIILGFAAGDKIDLSAIDAVAGGANDAFTFIGFGAFTAAGQVRLVQEAGGEWQLQANVDADLGADMVIGISTAGGYVPIEADLVL